MNIASSKKIWVINFFAGTPESGWGERHFYFSKHWIQNGYKVIVISSAYNHLFSKLPRQTGKFTDENYQGVDFVWVDVPKYDPKSIKRFWSMLVFAWRVLQLPVKKYGKPDTVLVSSMPIFPIWSGVRMKRKWGAKLIFEIRDIWPLTLQLLGNISTWHPAVLFIGWFEKLGYKKSDVVVSLLPNAKEHFNTIAGKEVNFAYVPNGIDPSQLIQLDIPEDLLNLIPKDKFIVGYAGTIGLANALEHFIAAAGLLKEDKSVHFVIVGEGYLKEELQRVSLGWGNVTFYPKIKKNQVQHLLSFFDVCFVGRSGSELFKHGVSANKYFDYMLAGKPILDSNNYIKDPVELSGCGIIVKPDSAEAIIEGIRILTSMSAEERSLMGAKGKNYVLKEHSIKQLALNYEKLF